MPFGSIKEQVHSGSYSRGYVPRSAPRTPPPLSRGGPPLAPKPAPSKQFTRSVPSSQPFEAAQRQAQRRVEATRPRAAPAPYIPRLPNPTPEQVRTALSIAQRAQMRAVGPRPTQQRISEYHGELQRTNPEYVQTLVHYAKAGEEHQAETLGRVVAGGGQNAASANTKAGRAITRDAAIRLGKGLLAQGAGRTATARAAPAPKGIGVPLLGMIVPGGALQNAERTIAAATPGLQSGTPEAQFALNSLGDVGSIAEFPFVGGTQLMKGGVALAKGNPKPLEQFGTGIAKGVWEGAGAQLLRGHLTKAENAFRAHPLISALEVEGAASAVGRGAGAVARAAGSTPGDVGVRGALARAGSTVRPPVGLTGDAGAAAQGVVRERTYSKDLHRKALQVAADRQRQAVTDANGKPITYLDRGRNVTVLRPSARKAEAFQHARANFEASRANSVERHVRQEAARTVAETTARPGRLPLVAREKVSPQVRRSLPVRASAVSLRSSTGLGNDLAQLVASGTIRGVSTFAEDLAKRAAVIEDAVKHPERYRTAGTKANAGELRAAMANARVLRAASKDPRVLAQAPAIVEQGLAQAKALNAGDKMLAERHVNDPAELERARLSEYALAHMGARNFTVADHRAAMDAAASPAERLAVSARDPAAVAAHEALTAKHAEARSAVPKVQQELRRAEAARSRLVGVQRVRGRSAGQDARAAAGGGSAMAAADARVAGARDALRAANAEHVVARNAAKGSKLPDLQEGLRKANGAFLSNDEIRSHMQASGRHPDTVAYVPHTLVTDNPRSFHKQFRPGTRPVANGQRRTGELYQRGSTAFGHDLVREELTNKATTIAKVDQLDKMIHESGLRHPVVEKAARGEKLTAAEQGVVDKGGYLTAAEAEELGKRLAVDGRDQYVPVRAFAGKLSGETQAALRDAQSPGAMETAHLSLLNDRLVKPGDASRARNVVMMPVHQLNQLERHVRPAGEVEKFVQLLNGPFRMAVLPQPRWLTGNFIEPYIVRLPLSGAGINLPGALMDIRAGSKALRVMERSGDPALRQAAVEIRAHQFGGLFVGRRGASVYRMYKDFSGNTARALYGAHVARNLPVLRQLGDMVLTVPKVFFAVNRVIESAAQKQAFGKVVREDVQALTGSWAKTLTLGQRALHEAAQGLVDTPTQHRFMDAQHEMLGKYEGFSPVTRRLIQSAMPFLPWTLASMRFVFWTVPAHHTVAFTAFMKAGQAIQADWEAQHANTPPGTLRDALIRPDGGLVDVARYTPFGATIPLKYGQAEGPVGTLLPQVSGALEALSNRDPFGRPLQVPKSPSKPKGEASGGQRVLIALNQLLESMVPGVATARRLEEKGGTSYPTSTVFSPQSKLGTSHMSALPRTFDPFRPTYLEKSGLGSVLTPAPESAPDRVRKAMREESGRSSAAPDAVREAMRGGVQSESALESLPRGVSRATPLQVDAGEARQRAFGPIPGLKSGDRFLEALLPPRSVPFRAAQMTPSGGQGKRKTAPYGPANVRPEPIPSGPSPLAPLLSWARDRHGRKVLLRRRRGELRV